VTQGDVGRKTYYRSTDSGQTWQRGATIITESDLVFSDGLRGYAPSLSTGDYYVTHDGGMTWSTESFKN
jgi:photosystem II stability/assembly factor-like uncharacterized protein